jgi:hypothetical protein
MLLAHGGPFFKLFSPSSEETAAFATAEGDWIEQAGWPLIGLFPHLETLSTGAFLGGQEEVWKPYWDIPGKRADIDLLMTGARQAVTSLALNTDRTAILCQRVAYGPLLFVDPLNLALANPAAENSHLPSEKVAVIQHRRHLDAVECGSIPAAIGGHSRWYGTYNKQTYEEDNVALGRAIAALAFVVSGQLYFRERAKRSGMSPQTIGGTDIDVEIYLPPPFMVPTMAKKIREVLHMSFRGVLEQYGYAPWSTIKDDNWRLKPIEEAPPCEACGWCTDDI